MSNLAERSCEPCQSGVPPLRAEEMEPLLGQLDAGWEVVDDHHLHRTFRFKDFVRAMAFANRLGDMAEEQGHHPDLHIAWGKVGVEIWTHKIKGLHEADFVFAAKCDALYPQT